MSRVGRSRSNRNRPIAAADVGRYLRSLASLNRDAQTGNPELAEALYRLSIVLIESKSLPTDVAAERAIDQGTLSFDDDYDFSNLTLNQVREILSKSNTSKISLIIIGVERLGIARSRLEKLPRDEIIKTVRAAVEHEESLQIISKEAEKGGRARES